MNPRADEAAGPAQASGRDPSATAASLAGMPASRSRAARRAFVKQHHPDAGGEHTAFVAGFADLDRARATAPASAGPASRRPDRFDGPVSFVAPRTPVRAVTSALAPAARQLAGWVQARAHALRARQDPVPPTSHDDTEHRRGRPRLGRWQAGPPRRGRQGKRPERRKEKHSEQQPETGSAA